METDVNQINRKFWSEWLYSSLHYKRKKKRKRREEAKADDEAVIGREKAAEGRGGTDWLAPETSSDLESPALLKDVDLGARGCLIHNTHRCYLPREMQT